MSNINMVVIEGNLVKAAELSRWSNGTPYCKFTIANNESYKDEAGNWTDIPSYFDCIIKGNYGESMHKHLLKGRRVTVTGRLKQNKWKDESGASHFAIIIKVNEVSLSPGSFTPKEGQQQDAAPSFKPAGYEQQPEENYEAPPVDDFADSDIPF